MRAACRRAFSRGRNELRALENISKLKLYKGENLNVAIQTAKALQQQRIGLTRNNAYVLLQESEKRKDLGLARAVQSLMCLSCLDSIATLQELLIRSFAHHKCLLEANQAFDSIGKPTAYSWAVIIMANAKLGQALLALELCYRIEISGSRSDTHVYVAIFKACSIMKTVPYARITHEEVIESGCQSEVIIGSILVHMYAACGSFEEAVKSFVNVQNPNVVCWNALITGYMQRGQYSLALDCFKKMQQEGVRPNVVSWNALIAGYVQHEEGFQALVSFEKMQQGGIKPDEVTFLSVVKGCASIGAIERGRIIHEQILRNGWETNEVGNALVDMYAKCGSMEEACEVFHRLPNRNEVSWCAMIAGYDRCGESILALEYYEMMELEGVKQDMFTFSSILKACGNIGAIAQGSLIHDTIIKSGIVPDDVMKNILIDMYAKCGNLDAAWKNFDKLANKDVVSWNSLIAGYAQYGEGYLAGKYHEEMQQKDTKPNSASFTNILTACNRTGLVEEGHWYLKSMRNHHGIIPSVTHSTCMVDLLGHAGFLNEAQCLLHSMPQIDITILVSLLNACRMHKNVEVARSCYEHIIHLESSSQRAHHQTVL